MKSSNTVRAAATGLMAALLCVISPMTVNLPSAVPITLGSLGVYLSAAVLGKREGTVSVLIYLLLGAVGLPVFSGFRGGLQQFVSPTGGYLAGYVACAFLSGLIIELTGGKKWAYPVALTVGTAVIYVFGVGGIMLITHVSLAAALMTGAVPFLVGDLIKIAVASVLAYSVKNALAKQGLIS